MMMMTRFNTYPKEYHRINTYYTLCSNYCYHIDYKKYLPYPQRDVLKSVKGPPIDRRYYHIIAAQLDGWRGAATHVKRR